MSNLFLDGVEVRKVRWRSDFAKSKGVEPHFVWIGRGSDGLEVVYGTSSSRLNDSTVREVWRDRQGHRAAPILLVISYSSSQQRRTILCGPAGESPPVVGLDPGQAERLATSSLDEPDRHAATLHLAEALEEGASEHPGLRNRGLLATHELLYGVPERPDWDAAVERSKLLLGKRGRDLIHGLGFQIEQRPNHSVLRSSKQRAQAVAVFLQEDEQADQPSSRFENRTPVTYALTQADRDNIPWVVAERSGSVRLYSTATSGAAGQRGRTETFVELNLPLLPSDKAGYLGLLFSSDALAEDGTVYGIQRASSDYTSSLSDRLRERVYRQVVPNLAVCVARQVGGTGEDDLERHYRTALTVLFRLMFVAYAEDSRLLPLHVNGEYTDHALKTIARRLAEEMNAGHTLGFDNPFSGEVEPDEDYNTDLWDSCNALFHAVSEGHIRWGVPAYNGGLFSSDESVNPVGPTIENLTLSNAEFGPILAALIVDKSPDDLIGPIDFRSLSVREFGTVYEGLLESELSVAETPLTVNSDSVYIPAQDTDEVFVEAGDVYLHNQSGVRKSTGSYFTKPFAVDHLIKQSVEPTLDEHLKRVKTLLDSGKPADASEMLFDFRVADIAMGSGHFLTAVVDRLEARYTSFLNDNPVPEINRELDALRKTATGALGVLADTVEIENSSLLRRLIARRCVYGVDMNPISVELARLAMWIHTFVPGLPLSFLDHNLVIGNALTGIGTVDEAAAALANTESSDSPSLLEGLINESLEQAEEPLRRLARITDATTSDIEQARKVATEASEAVAPVAGIFDLIVAARSNEATLPESFSPETLFKLDTSKASIQAERVQALHFPVAFPEVFLRERPGFDAMLGNPPWEEATVEKLGFWALRFPGLKSMTQQKQSQEIKELEKDRPDLVAEFEKSKEAAKKLRVLLLAGQYPGMEKGDPDLYKAFTWRFWNLLRQDGRSGVVLPRSALLASGSEKWRKAVLDSGTFGEVAMLLNNRRWVFPEVHPQYTIGLITLRKGRDERRSLRLRGPYPSYERYVEGMKQTATGFSIEDFQG